MSPLTKSRPTIITPDVALNRILFLGGWLVGAFASLACSAVAADSSATTQVEIVRLWTSFRDAASFTRLGQLPKIDDEPGDAIVLRSQAESRDGFYFTIRLRATGEKSATLADGQIVLHVVAPDAAQPKTFTFPFTAGGERSVQLLIGLTGADWTFGETMPLAWKLEIADTSGNIVGGQESFLWRKP